MIRNTKIFLFLSIFTLNSCETLQDMAGLTKPNLENDLVDQTPELVLPPDFDRVARRGDRDRPRTVINNNAAQVNNFSPNNATLKLILFLCQSCRSSIGSRSSAL